MTLVICKSLSNATLPPSFIRPSQVGNLRILQKYAAPLLSLSLEEEEECTSDRTEGTRTSNTVNDDGKKKNRRKNNKKKKKKEEEEEVYQQVETITVIHPSGEGGAYTGEGERQKDPAETEVEVEAEADYLHRIRRKGALGDFMVELVRSMQLHEAEVEEAHTAEAETEAASIHIRQALSSTSSTGSFAARAAQEERFIRMANRVLEGEEQEQAMTSMNEERLFLSGSGEDDRGDRGDRGDHAGDSDTYTMDTGASPWRSSNRLFSRTSPTSSPSLPPTAPQVCVSDVIGAYPAGARAAGLALPDRILVRPIGVYRGV